MGNTSALLLLCSLACAPIALILLMLDDAIGCRRAESAASLVFGAAAVLLLGGVLVAAIEVLYG